MRKIKYRIIFDCNDQYPFLVQKKGFLFWETINCFTTFEMAKKRILYLSKFSNKVLYETGKESEAKQND